MNNGSPILSIQDFIPKGQNMCPISAAPNCPIILIPSVFTPEASG